MPKGPHNHWPAANKPIRPPPTPSSIPNVIISQNSALSLSFRKYTDIKILEIESQIV